MPPEGFEPPTHDLGNPDDSSLGGVLGVVAAPGRGSRIPGICSADRGGVIVVVSAAGVYAMKTRGGARCVRWSRVQKFRTTSPAFTCGGAETASGRLSRSQLAAS